jgi:hypothetical protein
MTTSRSGIGLRNPVPGERVPIGTFGYFQARNKRHAYNIVMDQFYGSGISQAELARRLGKGTDQVCRMLAGPGNWTLDTFSDLLFAISGAAPVFSVEHPLNRPRRNQIGPSWLDSEEDDKRLSDTGDTADYPPIQRTQLEPV